RLGARRLHRRPGGRRHRFARPLVHDRDAASVAGARHRPRHRARARIDVDLSADGARARCASRRLVPRRGTRVMGAAARVYQTTAAAVLSRLSFDQCMAAGLIALFALTPLVGFAGSYTLLIAQRAMIFAIAALSLELLVGAGGLLSFGHAAFLGIGAYAAGVLASHHLGTLSLALPAALAASALFALSTGAIAVRTRGVYFIMITLAFGQMAYFVASSLAPYGGDDGLSFPSRTLLFGRPLLKNETVFLYVTLAFLALAYALIYRLVGSRFGRVLRGLTDN